MPYLGIRQNCGYISDEIRCKVIQHNCVSILIHGINSFSFKTDKVQDIPVAFNTIQENVSTYFSLVHKVIKFVRNQLLDEKKAFLYKSLV